MTTKLNKKRYPNHCQNNQRVHLFWVFGRERETYYLVQIHDYQGPSMRDTENEGEPRKT